MRAGWLAVGVRGCLYELRAGLEFDEALALHGERALLVATRAPAEVVKVPVLDKLRQDVGDQDAKGDTEQGGRASGDVLDHHELDDQSGSDAERNDEREIGVFHESVVERDALHNAEKDDIADGALVSAGIDGACEFDDGDAYAQA